MEEIPEKFVVVKQEPLLMDDKDVKIAELCRPDLAPDTLVEPTPFISTSSETSMVWLGSQIKQEPNESEKLESSKKEVTAMKMREQAVSTKLEQIKKEPKVILKSNEMSTAGLIVVGSDTIKQEPELIIEPDELPVESGLLSEAKSEKSTKSSKRHKKSSDLPKCYICEKIFNDSKSLENHQLDHMDMLPYECDECTRESDLPVRITSLVQLHRHFQLHAIGFKCPKCPHLASTKRTLYMHNYSKHGKTSQIEYTCEICGKKVISKTLLVRHMYQHKSLDEKRFTCSFCDKKFSFKSELTVHERRHTKEEPYKCQHCTRTFQRLHNLKDHERTHTGETPYTCADCGKRFRWSGSLQSHILAAHGLTNDPSKPMKVYKCESEGCDFNTVDRSKYYAHKGKHEKRFHCTLCPKRFSDCTQLKMHKVMHSGAKDFRCDQCQKSFRYKRSLAQHVAAHNDKRPFACKTCGKAYVQRSHLKKHFLRRTECQNTDQMDIIN